MSANRGARSKGGIGTIRYLISLALFAVAAALFIIVGVMYIRDRDNDSDTPPTPVSEPGHAELKNVYDALAAKGLKLDYIRGQGPSFDLLTRPTQGLTVDGHPIYIFIYDDPSQREAETGEISPDELDPLAPNNNATAPAEWSEPPHAVGGSNIYAVLFSTDADVIEKVDQAIQGIP